VLSGLLQVVGVEGRVLQVVILHLAQLFAFHRSAPRCVSDLRLKKDEFSERLDSPPYTVRAMNLRAERETLLREQRICSRRAQAQLWPALVCCRPCAVPDWEELKVSSLRCRTAPLSLPSGPDSAEHSVLRREAARRRPTRQRLRVPRGGSALGEFDAHTRRFQYEIRNQ